MQESQSPLKTVGPIPFGPLPNERQLFHFGLKKAFFHFGINTFTGAEWGDGTEALELFCPDSLDVRQWIRSIKAAGFTLAILTAKHHDGFCLWPTAHSERSIRNTPYRNGQGDLVREFTDACHEYGILVGLYLSPWDRYSPLWGTDAYSDEYAAQLTELMTGYGRIDEVWWDGAGSDKTHYRWDEWTAIIRRHQPQAAIFGSLGAAPYVDFRWVGNERGEAGETHFAVIDEQYLAVETPKLLYTGTHGCGRFIPSETDVSIRPGWFYKAEQDRHVKSVAALNRLWFESVGRNSMMLLNFPPDKRGLLCERDVQNAVDSHRCIQQMLAVNYAADALCTASSVLSEAYSPDKAVLPDDRLFYAAAEEARTVTIDLRLPKAQTVNVCCLGEAIQYGERITGFRLEAVTDDKAVLLAEGTSVGHLRALRFAEGSYSHFRLTITEASAAPILRTIGLYRFCDVPEELPQDMSDVELSQLQGATTEYNSTKTEATVSFGGIYPFNFVKFDLEAKGTYTLFAFDGLSYHKVTDGVTNPKGQVKLTLSQPQAGSYRILLQTSAPLVQTAGICVHLKRAERR